MVVGGQLGPYNNNITDNIELISPYPSLNPVPECLVDLNPFTFGNIRESVGAAVAPDGLPLMCGGTIVVDVGGGGFSASEMDECWMYDPSEDTWDETVGTFLFSTDHASDYTESFGFAMADVRWPLQVTEDNGVTFEQFAQYPNSDVVSDDAGCLVVVDDQGPDSIEKTCWL